MNEPRLIGHTISIVVPCECGRMARRVMTEAEAREHAAVVLASAENMKFSDSSEVSIAYQFPNARGQG